MFLPYDIPGLLQRGSSLRHEDGLRDSIVHNVRSRVGKVEWEACSGVWQSEPGWELDLTDATSRWHAAVWVTSILNSIESPAEWHAARVLLDQVERGGSMDSAQIDTLARLVLRLAGRAS